MLFNAPGKWDVYLSHSQSESQGEAIAISKALGAGRCWLDILMEDVSLPALEEGMSNSRVFLALLTPRYFLHEAQVREFDRAILNTRTQIVLACPRPHDPEAVLNTAPLSVQVWRAALVPRRVCALDFTEPGLFAEGVARLTGLLGEVAEAAPRVISLGASDYEISVTSGSGNQYLLMLRIRGSSATLTKQNPDGSVTTFKGRAPDSEGHVRLEGIQASNRGAFIQGTLPHDRAPGETFTLQAGPPLPARAPCRPWKHPAPSSCARAAAASVSRPPVPSPAGESIRQRRSGLGVLISREAVDTGGQKLRSARQQHHRHSFSYMMMR